MIFFIIQMSKQTLIRSLIDAENGIRAHASPYLPDLLIQRLCLWAVRAPRTLILLSDCITKPPSASFLEYARKDEDGRIVDSYSLHLSALQSASEVIFVIVVFFSISTLAVLASISF